MKLQDIFYPLIVLTCVEVSVVTSAFGDDKRNIVGKIDDQHKHNSKVKGRHRSSYMSLHEKNFADPDANRQHFKAHRSPVMPKIQKVTPKATVGNVLPTTKTVAAPADKHGKGNQTNVGNHVFSGKKGVMDQMDMKTVFFILLGISSLVIAYFVIRIARSKSRRKTKKYGVLATHGSEVELRPLEQDDEDEDMTVFDANSH